MTEKYFARILVLLTVAGLAFSPAALATNGYFAAGQGTRAKAMGGAGAAFPQDAIAAATNPAGMALVGERYDVGGSVFNPNRSYATSGNAGFIATAAQTSDGDFFLIPHFGINWQIAEKQTIGLSVYGNGGMNTDYPNPVFADQTGQASSTGVDFSQLFVSGTYAIDFGNVQLGASLILAYQQFSAEGLQAFDNPLFTINPGFVTNNGDDTATGFGLRLGALVDVGSGIKLGASYQPEIDMEEFDKYKGLFPNGGDFDIPSTYTVGASLEIGGNVVIALDFMTINYTDVPAVSNPGESLIGFDPASGFPTVPAGSQLGDSNGLGFGWQDIDIIKLGVAWMLDDDWTLRAGINSGDNPIPPTETFFNIITPGVIEDHISVGFSVVVGEDSEISTAFTHALENTATGTLSPFVGGGTNSLTMDQNEVEVSYSKKF